MLRGNKGPHFRYEDNLKDYGFITVETNVCQFYFIFLYKDRCYVSHWFSPELVYVGTFN